jgi:PD-(D/E)XK nuclease superfamily
VSEPTRAAIKLAPSDLTFLWNECKRCFWLKANGILKRPPAPFPKIFGALDRQSKDHFFGKRTEDMGLGLRPGRVILGDRWLRSAPIFVPGHQQAVKIEGVIDTALQFADGTYAIVDFKTSEPKPEHVPFYSRQLHAYALCAENPAHGALRLSPVSQLGLICIEPVGMLDLNGDVAYQGTTTWLEIQRDDGAFIALLSEVLFLLERPDPPEPNPECSFCRYLAIGSLVLLTQTFDG